MGDFFSLSPIKVLSQLPLTVSTGRLSLKSGKSNRGSVTSNNSKRSSLAEKLSYFQADEGDDTMKSSRAGGPIREDYIEEDNVVIQKDESTQRSSISEKSNSQKSTEESGSLENQLPETDLGPLTQTIPTPPNREVSILKLCNFERKLSRLHLNT